MSVQQLPTGTVPDDWEVRCLRDVCLKIGSGATPRGGASVYIDDGVAFIRSQNVLDSEFSADGLAHITDAAAAALNGVTVEPGDVLLNITGDSILRSCLAPDSALPARVSQHVAIVRSNGAILPQVLQKYLSISAVKDYMLGHSSGGTRKAITKGHIEGFLVPVPPLPEQEMMADVLGALDDRIDSNRRQIRVLDMVSQTEWLRAYSAGSANWPEVSVGEICGTQYGYTTSATLEHAGPHFLRVTDINKRNWIEWESVPYATADDAVRNRYGLRPGDLVVARMADPGKAAIIEGEIDAIFASYLVRLTASSLTDAYFMYGFLKSRAFAEYAQGATSGSVQKNMNARVIAEARLRWPPEPVRDQYFAAIVNERRLLNCLVEQNARLADLRDALLPELLSGRLRVKDARLLSEAVG